MLISVVIPCYYSEKTIRKVVELVMAEFEKMMVMKRSANTRLPF